MKKYPLATARRAGRELAGGTVQRDRSTEPLAGGWTNFHYSFTEISAAGSTARVKTRRASLENGRLVSESFEGELDSDAYERALGEAQRRFSEQTALFARSLFGFLAWPGKARSEWD
jgi:hypothetical protein